ncbi:MFS transporter [Taibaiella sp. KBW10]|uniref:MFS transporter n=1 Tax=Taibaiella sp. KBW10 TaxID=2153357 RepID=UPI000F59B3C3|nr:MFS transporter [Taibaiella sp. KBW10]RQO32235.1 MFS transporter [Taibaiella sp. KBW10]
MTQKSLLALAFGAFAIGMTEFTMMGILPDIAKDLHIDIPTAGHLIALYALGVVVGAPILVLFTAKFPPKKVLFYLMLLFVVFNGLFALAPYYPLLLITRFLSGLPHGAFFGIGAVVASKISGEGKAARAIAVMFTGMTVANLIGVPIGTYIGHHFSWRYTYLFISLFGVVTMLAIRYWLPVMAAFSDQKVFKQLAYFKTKTAWAMIGMIAIGTGGMFAWLSYIAPLMTSIAGVAENSIPLVMVLVGLGMLVGNLLGGRLADALTPARAATISFSAMGLCLLLIYFTAQYTPMAYAMSFITGLAAFSNSAPLQMMLINSANGSETLAAAAGQASFNLGNTFGAFFGGLPITYGLAYNAPVLFGVGMAGIGVLFAASFLITQKRYKALAA